MKRSHRSQYGLVRLPRQNLIPWLLAGAGASFLAYYWMQTHTTELDVANDAGEDDGSSKGILDVLGLSKTVIGNSGPMLVAPVGNGQFMRVDAAEAFNRMIDAAARDGITLLAGSAFRSVAQQAALYAAYVARAFTYPTVAQPGKSNHGNGTANDIAVAPGVSVHFDTPAFAWLTANAGMFGFSWDEGRRVNEPWHWRYTG